MVVLEFALYYIIPCWGCERVFFMVVALHIYRLSYTKYYYYLAMIFDLLTILMIDCIGPSIKVDS